MAFEHRFLLPDPPSLFKRAGEVPVQKADPNPFEERKHFKGGFLVIKF
jgi:hypothetical protein